MATRGVKTLDFGGTKEIVYERADFPKAKLHQIFKDDTFAVMGYGTQGRAQALNLRDNGLKVILGLREGPSFELAKEDGFVPGENLFSIPEAAQKASVIMYLLSDAGQKTGWDTIKPFVTTGKTLYFSHGFSIVFSDQTGVVPPPDVDVILAAPKGSGTSVRRLFLEGKGINGSIAVWQDHSGKAHERACAMGVAIGCGYLYETTFQKEVLSDLTGERGILMGAIQGLFRAQYDVLRSKGHSPSEAFNETVEEATQSLYPLIAENGMDWMYANCSTTAQRGALDWWRPFYDASLPVFQKLYHSVETGEETRRSLESNSRKDYKQQLEEELRQIRDSEMWRAGQTVRSLRPERQSK
ncbi:ketol-acid reductoisomerase [Gonapodya prolifera JEL478]|uniref:Acetohydroxy-acid reductoisomerase n=1 Tax=Gonapodya prolifera (strain JEL478) TaxID=1344416 RepID=A0A139A7F9_GONPJ|nr:ketol-acid reductoisomerase [Gonapodya prolifera JEL478]|eukprot:KXS12608.1 ketol-acid reductoisomerase [Gonapodya prolifera JEL478]